MGTNMKVIPHRDAGTTRCPEQDLSIQVEVILPEETDGLRQVMKQ